MNVLFITKNMRQYLGASYQYDFLNELSKHFKVIPYGPGYQNFSPKKNINQVFELFSKKFDLIIIGHTFLSDKAGHYDSLISNLELKKIKNIPKIFILNKEYVNLEFKLQFIKENNFDLCITHHHDYKVYQEITNTRFIFLPFAINKEIFLKELNMKKKYDVFFSGILQNRNKFADQNDARVKIMKKFFISIFDIQLYKRQQYKNLNIFWNSIPRSKLQSFINQHFFGRSRLSFEDYASAMLKSRIVINTLSPFKLISPRYFETMASRAIVLCEESPIYKTFINEDFLVSFNTSLDNFDLKLQKAIELSNDKTFKDNAFDYVIKNHTWENRINALKKQIYKI